MASPTRVLICGTGSAAHVLGAVISAREGVEVSVLSLNIVRANEWREIGDSARLTVTARNDVHYEANGLAITSDPEVAARDCDLVIVSVPAFLHLQYLNALAPYLPDGCVIVGLPGQNGFEFDVRKALGARCASAIVINFESLPWICRTDEFGRSARILGSKSRLVGAMSGDVSSARVAQPVETLQALLGDTPRLVISGHPLGITLRAPNAYSHPPIMFGRWRNWNGAGLDAPPLFYQGVNEETAQLLEEVSEEVVTISRSIMREHPGIDLSQVITMYEWDIGCYGADIADKTNLMTALQTNSGYRGMTHPMILRDNGEYVPDFTHRFLTEDVPFGLVVIRGVAELAQVATPQIDRVLCWSQHAMGREYLVGKQLTGRDVASTRAPQRYGYTLDDILVA
jgi:NAD/NADP octopine/nopaline dehydrogenase-like protein